MSKGNDTETRAFGRIFLRCFGIHLEVEGKVHARRQASAGYPPSQAAIEDQSNIDDDIVEDVDPAEIKKLDKI